MATWVYPPIPPDQLKVKEEESLARELQWLLESLQDSLASLKEGLEECVALLAPKEPGSTLVLSSLRSESVKGFVTRVGTRIVKGDINLRLSSLAPNVPRGTPTYPSTRYALAQSGATASTPDLTLIPLLNLANYLNDCLDIIDVTRWTGQSTSAPFISGQLRLLSERLGECRKCLKGPARAATADTAQAVNSNNNDRNPWWLNSVPSSISNPPLHPNLSLHFGIQDASLVLTVRTLSSIQAPARDSESPHRQPTTTTTTTATHDGSEPGTTTTDSSISGLHSLRDRLFGLGLGHAHKSPTHDEMGDVFPWRRIRSRQARGDGEGDGGGSVNPSTSTSTNVDAGDGTTEQVQVQVREKVRVESGDPSLISVAAKLSALDHELRRCRFNLRVVMEEEDEEGEDEKEEEEH